MNMKAAASLTGSLLARKGAAYPAAYSAPSGLPSADGGSGGSQPERAYNDPRVIASAPPPPMAVPDPQMQDGRFVSDIPQMVAAPAPAPAVEGEDGLNIPQVMDKMGRVRLSVRLDPDRYLRVKMASARTRWSAQDIVIAALDRYLGGSSGESAENMEVDVDVDVDVDDSADADDGGEGTLN